MYAWAQHAHIVNALLRDADAKQVREATNGLQALKKESMHVKRQLIKHADGVRVHAACNHVCI